MMNFDPVPDDLILTGALCQLRRLREDDREQLLAVMTDPSVAAWWGQWDAERVRDELITLAPDDDTIVFGIDIGDGLAGIIQFAEDLEVQYHSASVDIALASGWQGRGIGGDAIRTLIRYLFDVRGHHRITIDPAAHNTRAIRAYEKLGFRPVGTMRQYEQGPDGTYHDGLLMDLLRDELT